MENGKKAAFAKEGIFDPNYLGRGSSDGFRSNPEIGLTKREYFAGIALQSFVNNYHSDCEYCAKMSVKMADALLAELEKTKNQ